MEKLLLTVDEAAQALSLSRSRIYLLISKGHIESMKIGGCRRIQKAALARFVDAQVSV